MQAYGGGGSHRLQRLSRRLQAAGSEKQVALEWDGDMATGSESLGEGGRCIKTGAMPSPFGCWAVADVTLDVTLDERKS